jgi:GTPase SAR1 family protein
MNIMLEKPLYKILIIGEESVGKTVNEIIIFNL